MPGASPGGPGPGVRRAGAEDPQHDVAAIFDAFNGVHLTMEVLGSPRRRDPAIETTNYFSCQSVAVLVANYRVTAPLFVVFCLAFVLNGPRHIFHERLATKTFSVHHALDAPSNSQELAEAHPHERLSSNIANSSKLEQANPCTSEI